jgi:hypothetical protein
MLVRRALMKNITSVVQATVFLFRLFEVPKTGSPPDSSAFLNVNQTLLSLTVARRQVGSLIPLPLRRTASSKYPHCIRSGDGRR